MNTQNKDTALSVKDDHQTRIFGINITTVIPFITMRWFSFSLSLVIIIVGIVLYVMRGGFSLGIDFKGGIKVEVQINKSDLTINDVRKVFTDQKLEADINTVGNPSEKHFMITLPLIVNASSSNEVEMITGFLGKNFGTDNVTVKGSEKVDARIGLDFGLKSFYLILITAGLILLYIIFRFDFFYGAGAVGALFHDVLVMLSFTLFLNIPIDITIIAALLTILGYSVNDTIVVFDRIRELHGLNKDGDYENIMDRSITQTLSRTIITSLTVFLVVLAVFIWGGIVLKNFALLLLIGIIDGTYSSIFIAAPITFMLRQTFDKNLKGSKASQRSAVKS